MIRKSAAMGVGEPGGAARDQVALPGREFVVEGAVERGEARRQIALERPFGGAVHAGLDRDSHTGFPGRTERFRSHGPWSYRRPGRLFRPPTGTRGPVEG